MQAAGLKTLQSVLQTSTRLVHAAPGRAAGAPVTSCVRRRCLHTSFPLHQVANDTTTDQNQQEGLQRDGSSNGIAEDVAAMPTTTTGGEPAPEDSTPEPRGKATKSRNRLALDGVKRQRAPKLPALRVPDWFLERAVFLH